MASLNPGMKTRRGDITPSMMIIVALIILLVVLALAYSLLTGKVQPLLDKKLTSLFENARFS